MNPMLRDVLLIVITSLVTLAISVVIMVAVVRGLMEEIERDNARRRR
jgi:cell division protein FtsL